MSIWMARLLLLKKLGAEHDKSVTHHNNTESNPCLVEDAKSASVLSSHQYLDTEDVYTHRNTHAKSLFLSLERICRLCGKPARNHLMEKQHDLDIVSAVRAVTNVSISSDDYYPKYVCADCIIDLKAALAFKRRCEETDMKFRQTVQPEHCPSVPVKLERHDFTMLLYEMKSRREASERLQRRKEKQQTKTAVDVSRGRALSAPGAPVAPYPTPKTRIRSGCVKCRTCYIRFPNWEMLRAHRAERACVRRSCPVCQKTVLDVSSHQRRMHQRREPGSFACPICGKRTHHAFAMKSHMLVHTDRYDYACRQCPYRGKHSVSLKMHMRRHTGERPYLCALCPRTFSNCSNFKKHSLVHKNVKFQCTECNKLFRCSRTLRDHVAANHMNIEHLCETCGKTFNCRSLLLRHERKIHKRESKRAYSNHTPGVASPSLLAEHASPQEERTDDSTTDYPPLPCTFFGNVKSQVAHEGGGNPPKWSTPS